MAKTCVHCTQGGFKAVTTPFFDKVEENAERDHRDYYELDSGHECMVYHPVELARILLEQSWIGVASLAENTEELSLQQTIKGRSTGI